jgi:hypothetical protein
MLSPPGRGRLRFRAQTKGACAFALGLLVLLSCTDIVGDRAQERISGLYVLKQVDGLPVPASIPAQNGCNRTVKRGIFTVTAAGPDVLPMYSYELPIEVDCQPVPSGLVRGFEDVGTWRFHSSQLAFKSMMGKGAYSAELGEESGNPAITVVQLGNSYKFVRIMRPDDPQGVVYVKFADQFAEPVAGVRMIFTFANGLEGGGTTPASGEFGTRGVVGECKISITPPAGFAVPSSQPNPFSVTVAEGTPLRVQVQLIKL